MSLLKHATAQYRSDFPLSFYFNELVKFVSNDKNEENDPFKTNIKLLVENMEKAFQHQRAQQLAAIPKSPSVSIGVQCSLLKNSSIEKKVLPEKPEKSMAETNEIGNRSNAPVAKKVDHQKQMDGGDPKKKFQAPSLQMILESIEKNSSTEKTSPEILGTSSVETNAMSNHSQAEVGKKVDPQTQKKYHGDLQKHIPCSVQEKPDTEKTSPAIKNQSPAQRGEKVYHQTLKEYYDNLLGGQSSCSIEENSSTEKNSPEIDGKSLVETNAMSDAH